MFFPPDLVLVLASHVNSRSTLAKLCRVSKAFRDIFTPVLYRDIFLDNCPFEYIERMSLLRKEQLGYVRVFGAGAGILDVDPGKDYEEMIEMSRRLLRGMTGLRSFTLEGRLLRDFNDDPSYDSDASGFDYDFEDSHPEGTIHPSSLGSPLQHLFALPHLTGLSLTNERGDDMDFRWRLPQFSNLRKLVLKGMERDRWSGNVDDIAEILLASPGLTSLGLSVRPYEDMSCDMIHKLIDCYDKKRVAREPPLAPLRLEELDLGLGFLPCAPIFFYSGNRYLELLTDLDALRTLSLGNSSIVPDGFVVRIFDVDEKLLAGAINLRSLSVERLSIDIVSLIQLLRENGPVPNLLTSLSVPQYFETFDFWPADEDEPWGQNLLGPQSHSVSVTMAMNIAQLGTDWKKIALGGEFESRINSQLRSYEERIDSLNQLLRNFVAECTELEVLSIPILPENIVSLKYVVMPQTKHLHTLIIPHGLVEDTLCPEMGDEDEAQRISLAREFFERNRVLMREDKEVFPLKYVGFGECVYVYLVDCEYVRPAARFGVGFEGIPVPWDTNREIDAHGVEEFMILKLGNDEARELLHA